MLSLVLSKSLLLMKLFLDPGASLCFVTHYISMNFGILLEQFLEPLIVSTPVDESILAQRVCRESTNHKDTMANLVELYIVDFDVILGM